jgi:predicted kinase
VLVVVSGPAGSGKTMLAHELARAVGCPAVCRDEIKEGMAHVTPGFVPAPGDELTVRTLPVFFGVLELLLRAGVTTVADAAFQDKTWRPRLAPLRRLARIRIVLRHLEAGDVVLAHGVRVARVLRLLTRVHRAGLAVRIEGRSRRGRGVPGRGHGVGTAARLVGLPLAAGGRSGSGAAHGKSEHSGQSPGCGEGGNTHEE